jgi:hypothetical protein
MQRPKVFNILKKINPLIYTMILLPRDVELKIISYADIDTRRALGIYTKLKVPADVQQRLEHWIPHPSFQAHADESCVSLGQHNNRQRSTYVISRRFGCSEKHPWTPLFHYFMGYVWYNPLKNDIIDRSLKKMLLLQQIVTIHYSSASVMSYILIF